MTKEETIQAFKNKEIVHFYDLYAYGPYECVYINCGDAECASCWDECSNFEEFWNSYGYIIEVEGTIVD